MKEEIRKLIKGWFHSKVGINLTHDPSLNSLVDQIEDAHNSINETIADIAYIAGIKRFYSGSSRADMAYFVELAIRFENKYKGVEWGVDGDYMEAIEEWAEINLKKSEI